MSNKIHSQKDSQKAMQLKQGSSLLEFIVCAPILLILMMVAFELNERIEQQVTAAIASSNRAWLSLPEKLADPTADQITEADILGMKAKDSKNELGIQSGVELENSDTVLTQSDFKRKSENYGLVVDRKTGKEAEDHAKIRATTKIGSNSWDEISTDLNKVSDELRQFVAKFTENDFVGKLFPKTHIEEQKVSWSINPGAGENVAITAIQRLGEYVKKGSSQDMEKLSGILSHQTSFLRRDPQFHPDQYTNEAMFGLVLGAAESKFSSDFNEECFMNFEKTMCGQTNGFWSRVEATHYLIKAPKYFLQCQCKSPFCLDLVFINVAWEVGKSIVISTVSNEFEKIIEKQVSNVIQSGIDSVKNSICKDSSGSDKCDIDGVFDGVKKSVDSEIGKATDKIDFNKSSHGSDLNP